MSALPWMAVVSTLGMDRKENGLLTLLNSITRGITNRGAPTTELAKWVCLHDMELVVNCSSESKEKEPMRHHGGFYISPHILQLGSRSLVVGDMLVLGKQ